jgi:hypothetical protein
VAEDVIGALLCLAQRRQFLLNRYPPVGQASEDLRSSTSRRAGRGASAAGCKRLVAWRGFVGCWLQAVIVTEVSVTLRLPNNAASGWSLCTAAAAAHLLQVLSFNGDLFV